MKLKGYTKYLRGQYPLADVEIERREKRHDWVIVVTVHKGGTWQEFLYRIVSEEEEIGEQGKRYEAGIAGWYNKNR